MAVARLDDVDYSLEIWGIRDQQDVVNWLEGTGDLDAVLLENFSGPSFSREIDLGTIITKFDAKGCFAVSNWGKLELELDDVAGDVVKLFDGSSPYINTVLADMDDPILFETQNDRYLTPATVQLLGTEKMISEYFPDPFSMVYDAGMLNFSYHWAVSLLEDENVILGVTQGVTPADVSGSSTGIDKVLDYNVISGDVDPVNDFRILFAPDGQGIADISIDTVNPLSNSGEICALPMVLEFAITGEMVDAYDSDLAEFMELNLGDDPTETEILQLVRDMLYFEKDWGSVRENISLENAAVEIRIKEDNVADKTFIVFRIYLLMVDGGSSGIVENVDIKGQNYLVIYDGEMDGKFSDPLQLLGSENGPDSTITSGGGGGGGCSLGFLPPLALLLIAPLLILIKKQR